MILSVCDSASVRFKHLSLSIKLVSVIIPWKVAEQYFYVLFCVKYGASLACE